MDIVHVLHLIFLYLNSQGPRSYFESGGRLTGGGGGGVENTFSQ